MHIVMSFVRYHGDTYNGVLCTQQSKVDDIARQLSSHLSPGPDRRRHRHRHKHGYSTSKPSSLHAGVAYVPRYGSNAIQMQLTSHGLFSPELRRIAFPRFPSKEAAYSPHATQVQRNTVRCSRTTTRPFTKSLVLLLGFPMGSDPRG